MKKILGLIAITAIAWLGSVGFISTKVEPVFDNVIEQAQNYMAESMPYMTYQKSEFKKGFFKSTAKSILTISPELFDGDEAIEVPFKHTIYNGPLLITKSGIKVGTSYIDTTLNMDGLSADIQSEISALFLDEEPIYSGVLTSFNGMATEEFEINAFSFNDGEVQLSVDKTAGSISVDKEMTVMSGYVSVGAIDFLMIDEQGQKTTANIAASKLDLDITEIYNGAMLAGLINFNLPMVSIVDDTNSIKLNQVILRSEGAENNDTYQSTMTMNIAEIDTQNMAGLSILPVSKLHSQFSVTGLDKAVVKALIDSTSDFNALVNGAEQVSEQEVDAIEAYLTAIGQAVKQGVEINNVIELSNEKGLAAINFDLMYIDEKSLSELKTIKDLVLALKGLLKIDIDVALVAGTPLDEVIQTPVAMGIAARSGDTYTSITRWNKGSVKINSQDFPFLDMFASELEQPLPWRL